VVVFQLVLILIKFWVAKDFNKKKKRKSNALIHLNLTLLIKLVSCVMASSPLALFHDPTLLVHLTDMTPSTRKPSEGVPKPILSKLLIKTSYCI
jgi:hypothetical protein